MSYANANMILAAMTALNQEKAYDRVDWDFLSTVLHYFRYGPETIQKMKTVYQNIEGKIKVKRTLVRSFSSEERTVA